MLIAHVDLNVFVCKDTLVRYLAIKYVVVKREKQDIPLGHKESCFPGWFDMSEKAILLLAS